MCKCVCVCVRVHMYIYTTGKRMYGDEEDAKEGRIGGEKNGRMEGRKNKTE